MRCEAQLGWSHRQLAPHTCTKLFFKRSEIRDDQSSHRNEGTKLATEQNKERRRVQLHKAPRGIFPFLRVLFWLIIFFLIGRDVRVALGILLVSRGTVPVASAAFGRPVLTIALAR